MWLGVPRDEPGGGIETGTITFDLEEPREAHVS